MAKMCRMIFRSRRRGKRQRSYWVWRAIESSEFLRIQLQVMDQADKLRKLIRTAEDSPRAADARLPMVVVSGARAGVGATTVAVNVAAVLADRGDRVLLVDADENSNSLAEVAAVSREVEYGVSDVLTGNADVIDAIVAAQVGMKVLASRRSHVAA